MPPLVSIVILSYRRPDLLELCLRSLEMHPPQGLAYEVIVVGNGLEIGALADIQRKFPHVLVESSPTNLGFAGGCNRGAQRAQGRYIALLNDDAEVDDGWLEALVETIESSPRVGAVGSRILFADGTLQEAGSILWSDGSTHHIGSGDDADAPEHAVARDVDYCSGASLLVRRALWDEVGGLEEDFHPAYYEDVDLCLAIEARGWRVVYEPRSVIRHLEGASTDAHFRAFLMRRNRARLQEKWTDALLLREPPPRDGAVAAAVAGATRRRQAAETAATPPAVTPPTGEVAARIAEPARGAAELEAELRVRRQEVADLETARRHLERDAAVRDEYIDEVRREAEADQARATALQSALEACRGELDGARHELLTAQAAVAEAQAQARLLEHLRYRLADRLNDASWRVPALHTGVKSALRAGNRLRELMRSRPRH